MNDLTTQHNTTAISRRSICANVDAAVLAWSRKHVRHAPFTRSVYVCMCMCMHVCVYICMAPSPGLCACMSCRSVCVDMWVCRACLRYHSPGLYVRMSYPVGAPVFWGFPDIKIFCKIEIPSSQGLYVCVNVICIHMI